VLPSAAGGIGDLDALLTSRGFLRTWPHRHGIDGAFVALLLKGGSAEPV
jgi:16S rRNA C967 or C1407 C5-methylase (RsmB/RsmF family)